MRKLKKMFLTIIVFTILVIVLLFGFHNSEKIVSEGIFIKNAINEDNSLNIEEKANYLIDKDIVEDENPYGFTWL